MVQFYFHITTTIFIQVVWSFLSNYICKIDKGHVIDLQLCRQHYVISAWSVEETQAVTITPLYRRHSTGTMATDKCQVSG